MMRSVIKIFGKEIYYDEYADKINKVVKVLSDFLTKFMVYGCLGIFFEVSNYTTFRILNKVPVLNIFFHPWEVDERLQLEVIWDAPIQTLFGMSSLWMFVVFGIGPILIVEPMFRYFRKKKVNVLLRGIAYSVGLLVFEFVCGHILNFITGYDIWIYSDALNFKTTSLSLVLLWFLMGLFAEHLYRRIIGFDISNQGQVDSQSITLSDVVGRLNAETEAAMSGSAPEDSEDA